MAEPGSEGKHLDVVDDAPNGSFESAEKFPTEAGSFEPDTTDASAGHSGLGESADTRLDSQDPRQSDRVPNGHSAPELLQQNGHNASADPEDEGSADSANPPQEPEEELWKKRLYFVRMPKFPEDNQYGAKVLQEEIDVYRSQVQLLNESMNVMRMQRDSAKESVADARESMNAATNAFQAKQREVEPLQTGKKNQNDMQRNVQAEFRDLEVRSEQELDAKIKEMEYHMSHESIPISQERQMVKHIKKLRDQRPRVRQYEEMYAGIENARAAVRSGQGELKELLNERQALFEDKQLQQTIFNKHRDELRSLDGKINEIRDERARVKEQQDGAYHRLQAIRQQSRGKKDAYYQNRRFSQEVRKLVKEGKLDEARQMCEEQTHAALGHLQGDPAWRKEYLDLWLHQRPPPYRITFDDYDFDEIPRQEGEEGNAGKGKDKSGKANGTKASPAAPALTGKEKAQAIIDAAFAEVKQDMARKANTGAAGEAVPGSDPGLPAPLPLPVAEEKADSKPPRPTKSAAKPARAVELFPEVFQRDEPFVPPSSISKVESAPKDKPDSEAAAAAAREQQARAQQESQRKKAKAAERKQKANQKRKAQEAERKAQDTAAKAEAAAQQKSQSDTSADSDTQQNQAVAAASDAAATASSSLSSAAAAALDKLPAAVKEAPARVSKAANKAANQAAKRSEALKRKLEAPKARNPRKKSWQAYARQCTRTVIQWSEEHKPELGLIGIVVLLLGIMTVLLNKRNATQPPGLVS